MLLNLHMYILGGIFRHIAVFKHKGLQEKLSDERDIIFCLLFVTSKALNANIYLYIIWLEPFEHMVCIDFDRKYILLIHTEAFPIVT